MAVSSDFKLCAQRDFLPSGIERLAYPVFTLRQVIIAADGEAEPIARGGFPVVEPVAEPCDIRAFDFRHDPFLPVPPVEVPVSAIGQGRGCGVVYEYMDSLYVCSIGRVFHPHDHGSIFGFIP